MLKTLEEEFGFKIKTIQTDNGREEHAYDNPRFVENVCRKVKLRISKLKEVENFCIEVESQESIHNHSAYAMVVG